MRRFVMAGLVILLGVAAAGTAFAQPELPDVLPKEFTCMSTQTKGASKFFAAKVKCASRCMTYFWKGIMPEGDCMPPYGGTTSLCVNDTVYGAKGAENKFELALDKACVSGPGANCPECYASGCGTTQSQDTVQTYEGQVDSFMPGFFCERAGAVPVEQKCQLNTAKIVAKYFYSAHKCYTHCFVDARSGGDTTTCLPPASDGATIVCLSKARVKAAAGIDKYCSGVLYPDSTPDCSGGYPDGPSWTHLIDIWVDSTIAPTFCASPSGAFLD
jgi:hypothetical protein